MAPGIINAQAQRLPKEKPINQHTAYSHPSVHAQIEANETDVQAISELTHALEKKVVVSITLSVDFIFFFCCNIYLHIIFEISLNALLESLPSYFRIKKRFPLRQPPFSLLFRATCADI